MILFKMVLQRSPEGAALLLAFYFSKPCCVEVLKHEDSRLEVTSLEVRYQIADENTVEDNLEELFGYAIKAWMVHKA